MSYESSALSSDALNQLEQAAKLILEAVSRARATSSPNLSIPQTQSGPSPTSEPITSLLDIVNEFLLAKARAGRSVNYLRVARAQLHALTRDFGERTFRSVTAAEIERWAYGQNWAPRTVKGHLITVRSLYSFAVARSYIVGNPALAVDFPTLENEPPLIHTPEQVRQTLVQSLDVDASACRCLAVRYFAGLRTSEAVALEEKEILHERGFIEVTAAKAKTRKRRLVTIQPALSAWLQATKERGGTLPLRQSNNRLLWAVQRSGVPWDKSVTRHSFCSYHLAKWRNAGDTALEAGHTEQMLFNHYREIVTPAIAEAFWSIRP